MKNIKLELSQVYYRVIDWKRFKVTKIDGSGAYLCCYEGDCSAIEFVWYGISSEKFNSIFADTRQQAIIKEINKRERKIKTLRKLIEEQK